MALACIVSVMGSVCIVVGFAWRRSKRRKCICVLAGVMRTGRSSWLALALTWRKRLPGVCESLHPPETLFVPAMQPSSLRVIRDEHQALAAMLRSMGLLLAQSRRASSLPSFDVLRAMLLYVDEYPERLHHPKESELLFPKVRKRAPELASVLDRLDLDHERGEAALRDLSHRLLAFEVLGEPRRAAFETALETYTRRYLEHMAIEEHDILPAAVRVLTPEDWSELDQAFAANLDPLTGHAAEDAYRPLFQKILSAAPAPIGFA